MALISAGWRYDEDRDEPLCAEIGMTVHNLRLYDAYVELEREAPDLARAYARKQAELMAAKDRYRMALGPAMATSCALWTARRDPRCPFYLQSIAHVRSLDALFHDEALRLHAAFDAEVRPQRHPMVRATVARARDILAGCQAVLVAGGHVGILRNRMAFFGMGELLRGRTVVAWSAGAMVLTERVFLYHDHTPGAHQPAELLDRGFDLVSGVVYLPHAATRLNTHDADALRILVARLAPSTVVTLEPGALLAGGVRSIGPVGTACRIDDEGRLLSLGVAAAEGAHAAGA